MIVQKLNNLITKSNEITQKEDTDITMAMSSLIQGYGSSADLSTPADLFNHGDIVGINPYYKSYTITEQSGTPITHNSNGSIIKVTNDYIQSSGPDQSNITFCKPMILNKYKKVCFDIEITNTSGSEWTLLYLQFGPLLPKNLLLGSYNFTLAKNIKIVTEAYSGGSNIWGTSPWYKKDRCILSINLDEFYEDRNVPLFMNIKYCTLYSKIYSIWFE